MLPLSHWCLRRLAIFSIVKEQTVSMFSIIFSFFQNCGFSFHSHSFEQSACCCVIKVLCRPSPFRNRPFVANSQLPPTPPVNFNYLNYLFSKENFKIANALPTSKSAQFFPFQVFLLNSKLTEKVWDVLSKLDRLKLQCG